MTTASISISNWPNFRGESYTVIIKRDPKTDVAVLEQWFNEKGELHRVEGPAEIQRGVDDGAILARRWFENGVALKPRQRPPSKGKTPTAPSPECTKEIYTVKTERAPYTGVVWLEQWFNEKGELHRVGGPAEIQRATDNGAILVRYWFENDHGPPAAATTNAGEKYYPDIDWS
jgi:hypothetical protein